MEGQWRGRTDGLQRSIRKFGEVNVKINQVLHTKIHAVYCKSIIPE